MLLAVPWSKAPASNPLAYLPRLDYPGFIEQPDAVPIAGKEHPAPDVAGVECPDFIITLATEVPGGYQICVQANNQGSGHAWRLYNGTTLISTLSGPNRCWTVVPTTNPIFTIEHYMNDALTCSLYVVVQSNEECPEDAIMASVENCHFEANIRVDITSIGTPYVITFGDGSLAQQSSTGELVHTYPNAGSFEVCVTYLVGEVGYITCCYDIQVTDCSCPQDVIQLTALEPCTWVATLTFDLPASNFPMTVNFGDGTSEVVTSSPVTHDYPTNTCYNVCYTYEPFPGEPIPCCELVCLPGCCLDPSFSLSPIYPTDRCINPLYSISDVACTGSVPEVTHHWVFSDGTTYDGPFPPNHLFTNFYDPNGQVWVTHYVTCCDQTVSATVYAVHPFPGAYIGDPLLETHFSDIVPTTGQKVWEFIQTHQSLSVPLIIEGTLVVNENTTTPFQNGIWNMSKDAEIFVEGFSLTDYRKLSLDNITIRSAVRLPESPACCRWKGIRSEGLTEISVNNSSLMDANYAILYATPGGAAASPFPKLKSIDADYINNYYGIKSEGQYVKFDDFKGNLMDGAPHNPQLCDCNGINAIDFRDANSTVSLRIVPSVFSDYNNTILHYEQAFHFSNTGLTVRGFNIHSLRNYLPVAGLPNNPPGDAAIGIDFSWTNSGASTLNMDYMHFSDFDFEKDEAKSYAVRENIRGSLHRLSATANVPHSSIQTSNLAGGYEITIGSGATLSGNIVNNDISTNGGNYGFGVKGSFKTANNLLNVSGNLFSIGSNPGTPTPDLNGGVILASLAPTSQAFKILGNTIDLHMPEGAGIGITNSSGSIVRRNTLTNNSDVTGIQLRRSGKGRIECNNIRHKTLGMSVEGSSLNQYAANYLRSNINDVIFSAHNGNSTIKWNIFNGSDQESILYNNGAITGEQFHNQYNRWQVQPTQPPPPQPAIWELVHSTPPAVDQCRFLRPLGVALGSETFPFSDPSTLFFEDQLGQTIDTIPPSGFCTSAGDGFDDPPSPDDPKVIQELVENSDYWYALTTAEQTFMQQEIYGLLLEHPDWVESSTSLSEFHAAHVEGFVGLSETLRRDWQQLLNDISEYQATLEPAYAAIDSLSNYAQQLTDAIQATNNQTERDSLQNLLDATLSQGNSLLAQLQQSDAQFYQEVQVSVEELQSLNGALDYSQWHTWCEKRYNEIALAWLKGIEPDSAATADLRQIAQTCLSDGGRAVLSARGVCEVWLQEYYSEDGCQGTPEERSAKQEKKAAPSPEQLTVIPNPASESVRIRLNSSMEQPAKRHLQVLTMSGQQVYAVEFPAEGVELSVPVGTWPAGIYLIKIVVGEETLNRTFVVQHR
jgi:hypothetical protein